MARVIRAMAAAAGRLAHMNKRLRLVLLCAAAVLAAALVLIFALPGKAPVQQASVDMPVPTYSAPTPSPSPLPTTPPDVTKDPTMQKGDENADVQVLQERLMVLGYLDIDESTQLFGPATKMAVEYFQRQNDLDQDGIAGIETLNEIFADDAPKYMLLEGTRGEDVDSLQRQLIDLGYMNKATGYYGTETKKAVEDFQKTNRITVDGKTGPQTLDLIYSPNAKPSPDKAEEIRRRANINEMIACAQKQLGKRYIRGNEGPNSFDCSGLVYYCLKTAGSNRGRYNAAGYSKVSEWETISSMSKLQKGDLLFFWDSGKTKVGHVGICIGGGMMIDASSSNGKVVKRSYNTAYWKKMFVRGKRPW